MIEKRPLAQELDLVRDALAGAFSRLAFGWQLGGTMAAAFCFAVAYSLSLAQAGAAARFVLVGLGFILGYTVLWATGCIVARVIESSACGRDDRGVAPLHFLIDHLGVAMLLPFFLATCAIAVAGFFCAPAALWRWDVWQAILVLPVPIVYALTLLVVTALLVLLFTVPAMCVVDGLRLAEAVRQSLRLFLRRKVALIRLLGVGLSVALLIVVPVLLVASASAGVCYWIYVTASQRPDIWEFPKLILILVSATLVLAPVCALPLGFLNSLCLSGYRPLTDGLEQEDPKRTADGIPLVRLGEREDEPGENDTNDPSEASDG